MEYEGNLCSGQCLTLGHLTHSGKWVSLAQVLESQLTPLDDKDCSSVEDLLLILLCNGKDLSLKQSSLLSRVVI